MSGAGKQMVIVIVDLAWRRTKGIEVGGGEGWGKG